MKISKIKVNSFCCLRLPLSVAVAFLGAACFPWWISPWLVCSWAEVSGVVVWRTCWKALLCTFKMHDRLLLFRMEGNDRIEQSNYGTLVIVTLLHYCFKLKNANHCTAHWSKFRENCTHSKVRKRKIINHIVLLPPHNDLFFVFLSKLKR